jgi:hypothetical protein
MGRTPTVKQIAKRIRDALRSYADKEQWPPGSYKIYFRFTPGGFVHVLLVANSLKGTVGFDEWFRVQEFLQHTLATDPELLSRLRLGVRSSEQVGEGGFYEIAPDYAEIT